MGDVVSFNRAELNVIDVEATAGLLGVSCAALARMRKKDIGPRWVLLSPRRIGYQVVAIREYLERQGQGEWRAKAAA